MAEDPAYEPIMEAIRAYVKQHDDTEDGVIVSHAIVVWEEIVYTEDGEPAAAVRYCIPSPGFSPAAAAGLLLLGRRQVEQDTLGHRDDD